MNLPPVLIDGIPLFEAAFTAKPEQYYVLENGKWVPYNEKNFRLRLRNEGLSKRVPSKANLSPLEDAIRRVQIERQVDIAIPLAGYEAGCIHSAGKRVLVTESAKILPAKDVPWSNLEKYLNQLLGEEALPYHLGWWKWARQNIGNSKMLPGQVVFYVGPPGVGKSLLQHKITTELLGGLDGDPYDAMTGGTNFNSELFEAVHLIIEDRCFNRSRSRRRDFGNNIKQMAVNTTSKCHPKGKPGVMLTPKWRVSVSLNDEQEDLAALPELDSSILDKIMLFNCGKPEFPVDMGTLSGWEQWDAILKAELPGLAFAIDAFEFGDYAAPRYGVKAWHDPKLLSREKEFSPETILLEIIRKDMPMAVGDNQKWEGTSTDLCRVLRGQTMPSREQAGKIFGNYDVQNCGTYMGRLASSHPAISKKRIKGINTWHIDLGEL